MGKFENYQTFDPGRFLHSYFDILNVFNVTDDIHSLFFFFALKCKAYHPVRRLETSAKSYVQ